MEKFRSLLLFGAPGSGKGTVGKILAQVGGHLHVSSGDIFRGLDPESKGGKLFHKYASKGELVPDEATIEIWHYYMDDLVSAGKYDPATQFVLLDGIPRTVKQAEIMDDHIDLQGIIVLEAPDKEPLIKRLQKRATIEGRVDDADAAVLRNRMEVYEEKTAAILDHYPPALYTKINALQRPAEVLRDILVALAAKL